MSPHSIDQTLGGQRIAVVGAGVLGQALALHCLRAGAEVCLIEQDSATATAAQRRGSSYTAAGMLTPNTEVDAPDDVIAMGQIALRYWPEWLASFEAGELLQRGGCWVLAHRQDAPHFQHFLQQLSQRKLDANSTLPPHDEGKWQHFSQRLFFPDECWVNPLMVQQRLRGALQNAGCAMFDGVHIDTINAPRLRIHDHEQHFDWVCDCRGRFARTDLPALRGVRGEVIEVEAVDVEITELVRCLHPRYALYIVPREAQRYVIGATQIESDDDSPISVRSALELLSAAYSIDPAFGEGRIVAMKSNCRPALPDHRPHITLRAPGVLSINGLFRHGILLAPLLAKKSLEFLCAHEPFGKVSKEHVCQA